MTDKQLKQLCVKWQERLKISDWEVDIKFSSHRDMPEGLVGVCRAMTTQKYAQIRIIKDIPPDEDLETVVVHELMHIVYHPEMMGLGDINKTQNDLYEQATQATTEALVKGWRQGD